MSFLTGSFVSSDLSLKDACVETLLFYNRGRYPTFNTDKFLNLYDNFEVQMRFLKAASLTFKSYGVLRLINW
jgi:hypothetical protein